jgi:hypothetical protein
MLAIPQRKIALARTNVLYQGIITNLGTGTPSLTAIGTAQVSGAGVDTLTAGFTDLITAADMLWDVGYIELWFAGSAGAAADTSILLNLYLGAAAAEVLFIEHIAAGWKAAATVAPGYIGFPCYIPAGTRLSMKSQAITASKSVQVLAYLHPAKGQPGSRFGHPKRFAPIGTTATGSRGTSHTPGNSGAFSTEADLGAATTFEAKWIMLQVHGQGTKADTTMTNIAYHTQIRDTADDTKIFGEWWHGNTTGENQVLIPGHMIPCNIPRGTTLAIRSKASGTAEAQDFSVIIAA